MAERSRRGKKQIGDEEVPWSGACQAAPLTSIMQDRTLGTLHRNAPGSLDGSQAKMCARLVVTHALLRSKFAQNTLAHSADATTTIKHNYEGRLVRSNVANSP